MATLTERWTTMGYCTALYLVCSSKKLCLYIKRVLPVPCVLTINAHHGTVNVCYQAEKCSFDYLSPKISGSPSLPEPTTTTLEVLLLDLSNARACRQCPQRQCFESRLCLLL